MWVCVCVGFVMCGCFDNCVDYVYLYLLCFDLFVLCFLFFHLCIHVLICFVCTSVKTTATE